MSTAPSAMSQEASGKERRASRKVQQDPKPSASRTKTAVRLKIPVKPKAEPAPEPGEPAEPPRGKDGKPKSETYKQAWSVSEQHLLERLLEEIPEGEKNRCVHLPVRSSMLCR